MLFGVQKEYPPKNQHVPLKGTILKGNESSSNHHFSDMLTFRGGGGFRTFQKSDFSVWIRPNNQYFTNLEVLSSGFPSIVFATFVGEGT